ncbi:MAG: pitrilysin family protein [Rickettsiales bacterium]|nr:pitrilysin family protein [Rickettsiales bacterium]
MFNSTYLQIKLFILTALFLANSAWADKPAIHDFSLENGLRVIVIEDTRIPAISHNLLFKFGAADDPRGKSGLAHYMEHMLFQGTQKYKPNEYSKIIAAKGGKTNAFTTADYTGYWVNIAKEHLPLVMELEADRWENLQSADAEFTKEKQVILEERRARVDNNPGALFAEQLNAALYLHHPYGIPIIGWANEMESLDKTAVMDYYQRYQHPSNAVLILSGDISLSHAKMLAKRYYAPVKPRGEALPIRNAEPPQLAPRRLTMQHARVKQVELGKAYVTPSYGWRGDENKQHFIPLMIADYLLGGGKTSRLYQLLVEEKRLAQSVSTDFNPFRKGPGEFELNVLPTDANKLPEIEKLIATEVRKLMQTPPSEAELNRAKTQLIAGNIYLRDGLQSLAQVMGHLAMINLPLDYYFTWEETIEKVTAQQVSDSLKLLDESYSVTGVLSPKL